MILEALHDHYHLIKVASFEEMAKHNNDNKSAKELLD